MSRVNTYTYPKLRNEMGINGVSITDLANHLNISVGTMRNKLSERTQFDLKEALILSKLFNVSIEDLFKK